MSNLKFFNLSEFECRCGCGKSDMNQEFLERLDKAREIAGVPFVITSGFRCAKHNAAEGGVSESAHTKGLAVDIRTISSSERFAVVQAAIEAGFTRVGIANSFVHIDADPDKVQHVAWTYSK